MNQTKTPSQSGASFPASHVRQDREDRAVEAIIAGCLRGFTEADWKKVFEKMAGEYEVTYRVAVMMNEPRNGGGVTHWSPPETKVVRATGEKDAETQFREWAKTDEGRRKLWIAWEITGISFLPNAAGERLPAKNA